MPASPWSFFRIHLSTKIYWNTFPCVDAGPCVPTHAFDYISFSKKNNRLPLHISQLQAAIITNLIEFTRKVAPSSFSAFHNPNNIWFLIQPLVSFISEELFLK